MFLHLDRRVAPNNMHYAVDQYSLPTPTGQVEKSKNWGGPPNLSLAHIAGVTILILFFIIAALLLIPSVRLRCKLLVFKIVKKIPKIKKEKTPEQTSEYEIDLKQSKSSASEPITAKTESEVAKESC